MGARVVTVALCLLGRVGRSRRDEAAAGLTVTDWLLSPVERGNPATWLDRRHRDGAAWSAGNEVTPLIHGSVYFPDLLSHIRGMRAGDLLMFTDWRGDPD